ncbi:MAG: AIR carboxylase family protein [Candidatus Staskawiczbacteria bacterium]|jgi:phosphoribosylcarboxyaminoimidazole (NCAIR) mutase
MVPRIALVIGSKSDWPTVQPVVEQFEKSQVEIAVSSLSCHRNPYETKSFCGSRGGRRSRWLRGVNAVLCAGSKAFQLPGAIDAWLYANGVAIPVIGVALGAPGSRPWCAAKLSIEELPGTPVLMGQNGEYDECYLGPEGLEKAIRRVIARQLPPPKQRDDKPAEMNFWKNY